MHLTHHSQFLTEPRGDDEEEATASEDEDKAVTVVDFKASTTQVNILFCHMSESIVQEPIDSTTEKLKKKKKCESESDEDSLIDHPDVSFLL